MGITPQAIDEARHKPNSYVYKIEGAYSPDEFVPFEAIAGWWKVDEHGQIIDE
jgi:hypothetical protein